MSIILDHVNYIYDEDTAMAHAALTDVNIKIDAGEFIGLIGHTGSGKSTLIQHMNGLVKPTSGTVYFDGKDISDPEFDRKALRAKVGLVFQYPEHQLFETDCFKDVCFGPKNLGLSQKEVELRAYEALKQVGFDDDYFYQSPFDLSGGQKRRVAIAGVLAMKPEILILDEPTAGLDPKGREDILNLVKKLHDEVGITIILVSHSMDDVADYVDRIIVMNKGKVAFDDVPKEVFRHRQELEAIGLAAPQVTYVMQELKASGFDVDIDVTTLDEAKNEILRAFSK
ncbi:MAG: energy-coupling factor transporter ATPase [Butyrivibrio sp.]|jgi:energy-coupling factor transport system ATP-binding protein|uniref:energy-coupling factor transporter ATPase n=1 Tax=Butyrivibrio sp. LB2008 TaxID=1408305 RepID=UPI000478CE22|nr:energy-coupling factor transporter ATPase [Butyrivibrio sp. LB2008]MEE3494634.1 energy-coupling factor transporter ATPase [Butyrivibrio sp.]